MKHESNQRECDDALGFLLVLGFLTAVVVVRVLAVTGLLSGH